MEWLRQVRWWYIPAGLLGGAVALFWILVLAGQITWFSEQPPLQVIADMDDQFRVDPQEPSRFFADRRSFRIPPEGTVPRDGRSYPFSQAELAQAEATFNKPPFPSSEYVLAFGRNRYEIFCSPCHGADGKGNGPVVQRGFVPPPDLTRPEARAYSDARIFHVISAGQNIMPSYASKLTEAERWAVVYYVRQLQQQGSSKQEQVASAVLSPEQHQ